MPHFSVSCFLGFMAVHQVLSCFVYWKEVAAKYAIKKHFLRLKISKFCVIVFYRYALPTTGTGYWVVVF